jgi:hypothetical protein
MYQPVFAMHDSLYILTVRYILTTHGWSPTPAIIDEL